MSINAESREEMGDDEKRLYGQYYYAQGKAAMEQNEHQEALELFRKGALFGSCQCMFALGFIHYRGMGVEQSYEIALEWYLKAAEKGHVTSCNELGVLYEHGYGTTPNYEQALKWFKRSALKGDPDGMCNLGVMYHFGIGIKPNYGEAAFWFRKASAMGHMSATNSMAFLFETGRGVNKDVSQAFALYKRIALRGEEYAMINLSRCFETGIGCEKDLKKAQEWHNKCLEDGRMNHLYQIGMYYYRGSYNISVNYEKALTFLEKATERGCPHSEKKMHEVQNLVKIRRNFFGMSNILKNAKLTNTTIITF